MKELKELVRPNVWKLKPYSSARDEFHGEASVFLDANENPYNAPYNRYPDPMQWQVKERIAEIKGVEPKNILLGNGSDEPIDLLIRAFCEPAQDCILAIDPTYGMYKVAADVNNVPYIPVLLNDEFQFSAAGLLTHNAAETAKLLFLCSPNNPTGNSLRREEIRKVITGFQGIVVVDEAYIDFSSEPSFLSELKQHPNLVVLQTLSKAWGSAGVRLGMAFASPEIIAVLNKIKYPYNINQLTQKYALNLLDNPFKVKEWVRVLLEERTNLISALGSLPLIKKIYPTDANFVLVKVDDANGLYNYLVEQGVIVRNRTNISLCMGCLRITVGTPHENEALIESLKKATL